MGERSQKFTLEARLARDAVVQKADSALKKATLKRELCEEQVEVLSSLALLVRKYKY